MIEALQCARSSIISADGLLYRAFLFGVLNYSFLHEEYRFLRVTTNKKKFSLEAYFISTELD